MKNILTALLAATFACVTFASSDTTAMPEAMKSGDVKAQAAAQTQVDARSMGLNKPANMPEAMKHDNPMAEGNADARNAKKPKVSITPDEQMVRDQMKL